MTTAWTQREEPPATGASLTLVEGSSFALSDSNGNMRPDLPQGVFVRDTRVISTWRLRVDDDLLEPLSATAPEPFSGVFLGRTRSRHGMQGAQLVVERRRYVGDGLREDITLRNYGQEPLALRVTMDVDADFADLFEVKSGMLKNIGQRSVETLPEELHLALRVGARSRAARIKAPGAMVTLGQLTYNVTLPAKSNWSTTIEVLVVDDGKAVVTQFPASQPIAHTAPARHLNGHRGLRPEVHTDWADLARALVQSEEDLDVLRIADPDFPDIDVVAAGAPWFMTLFGRDALLASWMMLPFRADLALGSLRTLARLQGTKVDPATEEQPGRIPHELRRGLDAASKPGQVNVYYGTVDATPLFVMLLGEMRRWGHDRAAIEALLPAADRALAWIERDGDRDGDGFVEYQRSTAQGLRNQGWKDSFDSINFIDGTLAEPPIALAEVQGYVYAAYRARAHFADEAGDPAGQAMWTNKAEDLKEAFNERFWLPERGWYAVALDGNKRPVDALTSNIGHCLWTGIIDEDRAPVVADRLMSSEMFSGFGIRTLATSMGAYNPVSYHNGSVWPHENALIAAGLARYGQLEAAQGVAQGILAAATAFGGRLPELFCGFDRREQTVPVPYPASCSPQAWAAAAPVQLLRTVLRFDPAVPNGKVWLSPALPDGVEHLRVEGLVVGNAKLNVEVSGSHSSVQGLPDGVELVREPWPLERRTTPTPR